MVLEVVRHQHVPAPAVAIWPDIAQADRFAEWFAFCDTVEEPEPGIRVLIGSWGSQRSAVTTRTEVEQPPNRFAWTHVEERLDGRPAPRMSLATSVEVTLVDHPDGGTDVTITSRQVPAGTLQAIILRLVGKRQVANMLSQSLTLLAARHGGR